MSIQLNSENNDILSFFYKFQFFLHFLISKIRNRAVMNIEEINFIAKIEDLKLTKRNIYSRTYL